jgi:hypothetical protein
MWTFHNIKNKPPDHVFTIIAYMFKSLKIQEHVRTKRKICEIDLICDDILIGLNFI